MKSVMSSITKSPTLIELPTLAATVLACAVTGSAFAYDGTVEKQVFEMESYTTVGGETIENVKIGWESYGTLNEAKDNVILITQYYAGTSHAAGWDPVGESTGYWDAIIGSGLAIDTDKYFVISSDTVTSFEIRGTSSHDQAWVPDGAHGRS